MKKLLFTTTMLLIAGVSFGQWSLNGNAGTTTSNFIGTTDAQALRFRVKNTASGIIDSARRNTGLGYMSLFSVITAPSTSTGIYNSAFGSDALRNTTTGSYNTAYGTNSLQYNTTGYHNTANGSSSLNINTTGYSNTATGLRSLSGNTTGNSNTASGNYSMVNNISGNENTAFGDSALRNNAYGSNNTAIGNNADISTTNTVNNATAIGNRALVNASNIVRIGNTAVTSIGGQVAWTSFSDGRIKKNIKSDVPGLNFIKLLNPVTYNYDLKKQHALEGRTDNSQDYPGKDDIEKISFSGFIAQEVDEAAKKIGYTFSGVDKSGNIMGLRYSDFVVPVVKSVQELAKENEELKKENVEIKKENELIKNRLDKIEQLLSKYAGSNPAETLKKLSPSLEQNIPNPFNGSTSIGFSLPEKNSIAYINIYAQNGALAKSVKINGEGRNSITLNRNQLAAGVYNYVLVVDGKPADSKQMIIE